jgi:LysM repeat protein
MRAMSTPAVRALRCAGRVFCLAGLLLLGGCDLLTISQSGRGIRDGNDAVLRGEFPKAVQHYESALDGTLLTAEAHYRLGLVYEDKLKNEVAALHHFERYLELAPQGQFSTDVRSYVDRLRLVIVSRLAEGTVVPAREATRLKNENLELRQENAELRDQQSKAKTTAARAVPAASPIPRPALAALPEGTPPPLPASATPEPEVRRALPLSAPAPAAPVTAVAPASAAVPTPAPVPAAPQSHTVVSGDTLSKISRKYYGNSGDWQKIAEANKAILPDPTKLKLGMVLTIPPK